MARSIHSSFITSITAGIFAALSVAACALSIMYAGVLEKTEISYLTSVSLLLAFVTGFCGSFEDARHDLAVDDLELNMCFKHLAIKAAAVIVGLVAFGLSMFAMAYAGVIESAVTTTAAVLGLIVGFAAGFMAGFDPEAHNNQSQAQYDGPSVVNGRHYPRISIEKFRSRADRDVTDELPADEYAPWRPAKQQKKVA